MHLQAHLVERTKVAREGASPKDWDGVAVERRSAPVV